MDLQLLLFLWAGHYLADFSLQTTFMTEKKALIFIDKMGVHALTAHAFVHALVAGLITQNFTVAVVIGLSHWLIDFVRSSVYLRDFLKAKRLINGKKDFLFGIHTDQLLHFLVILIVTWRLS